MITQYHSEVEKNQGRVVVSDAWRVPVGDRRNVCRKSDMKQPDRLSIEKAEINKYLYAGSCAQAVTCGGSMTGRFDATTSARSRAASVSKSTSSAVAISNLSKSGSRL